MLKYYMKYNTLFEKNEKLATMKKMSKCIKENRRNSNLGARR